MKKKKSIFFRRFLPGVLSLALFFNTAVANTSLVFAAEPEQTLQEETGEAGAEGLSASEEAAEAATEEVTEAATETATEEATEAATETTASEEVTEAATETATETTAEAATEEATKTATEAATEEPASEEATEAATETATETTAEAATEASTEASTETEGTEDFGDLRYEPADTAEEILAMAYQGLDLATFFAGTCFADLSVADLALYVAAGMSMADILALYLPAYKELVVSEIGQGSSKLLRMTPNSTSDVYICQSVSAIGTVPTLSVASGGFTMWQITMYNGVTAFCLSPGNAMSSYANSGVTYPASSYTDYGTTSTYSKIVAWYVNESSQSAKEYAAAQLAIWASGNGDVPELTTGDINVLEYGAAEFRGIETYYAQIRAYITNGGTGLSSMGLSPSDSSYQRVLVWENPTNYTVSVTLTKQSAAASFTAADTTGAYGLSGAVYGVYTDAGCTSLFTTVTTAADGTATISGLMSGSTYYVQEITAPAGYERNTEVLSFTAGTGVSVTSVEVPKVPTLSMTKQSGNPDLTDGCGLYSLAGAKYQVYTDAACTSPATAYTFNADGSVSGTTDAILTTQADGSANTLSLLPGIYYVKEVQESTGYLLDTSVYRVVLSASDTETQTFTSTEVPVGDPALIEIYKTDDEGITMVQATGQTTATEIGGASLAGAVFKVSYYDDYYATAADLPGSATAVWYIETIYDEVQGGFVATLDSDHLASGYTSSDFYYGTSGLVIFPLGTVTYEEVSAPDGYKTLDEEGIMTDAGGVVSDNLSIMQVKAVDTNGDGHADRAYTYVRDYTATGVSVNVYSVLQEDSPLAVTEAIKRGDFSFVKTDYESSDTMAYVFFRVTSSSGESHIIVTDTRGYYSSSETSHTTNTNALDSYFDADGNYQGPSDLDDLIAELTALGGTGLWFYGTADETEWDTSTIDNSKGALRYDESYIIEELACPANAGKQLAARTLAITTDGANVWKGNISNVDIPSIGTLEWDADTETHYSAAVEGEDNTVVDTVSYMDLPAETTFTLKGILMELDENGEVSGPLLDDNGDYIRAYTVFTTGEAKYANVPYVSGSVDVTYTFPGGTLEGKRFVIFEYLYAGEDRTLVSVTGDTPDTTGIYTVNGTEILHAEETDVNQIGEFLALHTTAFEDSTGANVCEISETMNVKDIVNYSGLTAGYEYKIVAELVYQDKESGEVIPVKDLNGDDIVVTQYFVPLNESGTLVVTFPTFDGTQLLDSEGELLTSGVVAFESLYWNNRLYVSHKDTGDTNQTVFIPEIHTTAEDADTGMNISKADETVTIIDHCQYENVAPGRTYTMSGTLMDQSTGKPLTDAEGKEITATETFTATETSGTVDLTYTFDASLLAGKTAVVFEDLYYEGVRVAAHADLTDVPQTVYFPEVHTSLTGEGGSHQVILTSGTVITLTDTVSYANLIAGETYTVSGVLMNQRTGEALTVDGQEVAAEETFTATETEGTVEVTFTFDVQAAGLIRTGGLFDDVVAFETLTIATLDGEKEVAEHKDLTDTDQTVELRQRGRVYISKTAPFINGSEDYEVTLPNGQVYTITRLTYGQQAFAGITFTVFDAATDEAVTSFTTDAEGAAVSDYLVFGGGESYYVMETGTPAGLVQSSEKYEVTFANYDEIDLSYYTDTIEIYNDVTKAEINVYKTGEFIVPNTTDGYGVAQKGIEGVYFGIYTRNDILDNEGNVAIPADTLIGINKTTEEGCASITAAVTAGDYYFKEICTASEEYALDETEYDFSITYQRNTTDPVVRFDINYTSPVLNRFKSQNVMLYKTDEAGNPLAGVEFALYRSYTDGYIQIGTYWTDTDGIISIVNMPYGDYYFVETKGIDGYAFDGDTHYEFSINDETIDSGEVITVHAVNKRIPDVPQTGDHTPVFFAWLLMAIAAVLFSLFSLRLRLKFCKGEEKASIILTVGNITAVAFALFYQFVWGNTVVPIALMLCSVAVSLFVLAKGRYLLHPVRKRE